MHDRIIGIKIKGSNSQSGLKEIENLLISIREIGYKAIEIRPEDFDLIEYGEINEKFLIRLKRILDNFDFIISIHVPIRLNLFNLEYGEVHEKVLLSSLEICRFLRGKVLVYHPGRYVDNVEFARRGKPDVDQDEKEKLMELEREKISKFSENYREIMITMENHRPYLDFSPYSYAEFIDDLIFQVKKINKDNVKITLDTGHLNLSSSYHKFDIIESIKKAKPFVAHLHLQDNHGIVNFYTEKDKADMLPFGIGDEHLVPGRGNFPFYEFFKIYDDYEGIFMIELTSRYLFEEKMLEAFENVNNFLSINKL